MLTKNQKQKFLDISGIEYLEEHELEGKFMTPYPFNNKEWDLSPWHVSFIFDKSTNYLHIELDHRMTNNRIFCFDKNGESIEGKERFKFYQQHI